MIYQLTWLPAVLRHAGLKVAEVPGWESRGRGSMGQVFGVLGFAGGRFVALNPVIYEERELIQRIR